MSHEFTILEKILEGIRSVKLKAILIGSAALSLQGVPIMTQDIDFFTRDTEFNKKKSKNFLNYLTHHYIKNNML